MLQSNESKEKEMEQREVIEESQVEDVAEVAKTEVEEDKEVEESRETEEKQAESSKEKVPAIMKNQMFPAFGGNKPAKLEKGGLRFVITDSPSDATIANHAEQLKELNVKHVCRATDPTYSTAPLKKNGIQVHELSFEDGSPPPDIVLERWLDLVEQCFLKPKKKKKCSGVEIEPLTGSEKVSVHCVAGLGRAPILVAVALVEYCGLSSTEAVTFIRKERKGAFNKRQLKWLEDYSPKRQQLMGLCNCVIA